MYKLIGSPKTRTFRVIWMLEELGQEYEIDASGPHSEAANAANASGKIPSLQDGDHVINDSTAIIQYLADKHGQHTFPAGTIERAQQDSFTCFAQDELDGTLWVAAKHGFVYPEELRAEGVAAACKWDVARSLATLGRRLGNNEYVMGDRFTVPDIIIAHCCGWAKNSGMEIPAGTVSDYLGRVRSRPAFGKAVEVRDRY